MKIANRYMDEIEEIVNWSDDTSCVVDVVNEFWWRGRDTGRLFSFCRPMKSRARCGCLTGVKSGLAVAHSMGLTLEIRSDDSIASDPDDIAGDLSLKSFPISSRDKTALRKKLLPYARWQTRMHVWRFKDIPRSELVEVNERTGRVVKASEANH